MTLYNIIVSCPELSLEDTLYTLNLPDIYFDFGEGTVEVTATLVEQAYNKLKSFNKKKLKTSLLELIEMTAAT